VAEDVVGWSCKQIPNGMNPIVVCERQDLLDEIELLQQEINDLRHQIVTLSIPKDTP
jgi:hypothetical protein